jgi:hypothetical protein
VHNTDTLCGQNAELLFGLKAAEASTLPECYTDIFFDGWKGVPLLGTHSAGWDMGYRKYETNEIFKYA